MAWLSQFSLVMRSSITALREKVEDPERMLHQLILDMDEELCTVRSSVAEAIADEIQMRKRTEREQVELQKWSERAMVAMKRGDEASAKSALSQKLIISDRFEQYKSQHATQLSEVTKLQTAVRDLEDKIRQARQKKTLLMARMARANSTQKINGAIDRAGNLTVAQDANAPPPEATRPEATPKPPGWAREYLAEDPLVAKAPVTLDDIRQGIASPRRSGTVIDRHFKRVAGISQEEKRQFLSAALRNEPLEVQRQAARELAALGMLESVVRDLLLELVQSEDPELRQVAVIALEHVDCAHEDLPDAYWDALIEGLASKDSEIVRGITERLQELGASAVPSLVKALRSPTPVIQHEAAKALSNIIGSKQAREVMPMESRSPTSPGPIPTPSLTPNAVPMAKGPRATQPLLDVRHVDGENPKTVRVYFGTDRQLIQPEQPPWSKILLYPVLTVCLLISVLMDWRRSRDEKSRGCANVFLTTLFLIGVVWTLSVFRSELLDRWRIGTGPRFGPRRDSVKQVHYGTCDVSIPPKHESGKIEAPSIGPEDESLHVVLKKTEEMEEKTFFEAVHAKVVALPKEQRTCFVFIHGFNVTFENAAKRTAQIHYDLEFTGVPIFFSWPSRASLLHYFSDRNEIEYSRYVIKQFLLDVSQRVSADRIHVIAHSMGADATCHAIADLGERGKIFDQIILAAPDIDREVFRLQLAPRMFAAANRMTMYCSKDDMALRASNTFNDSPRAGDSRLGVLVTKELDTVDASGIDTALLGHSYYGDCLPILKDVRKLVSQHLPPKERNLVAWPVENELNYWTLMEQQVKTIGKTKSEKGDE